MPHCKTNNELASVVENAKSDAKAAFRVQAGVGPLFGPKWKEKWVAIFVLQRQVKALTSRPKALKGGQKLVSCYFISTIHVHCYTVLG